MRPPSVTGPSRADGRAGLLEGVGRDGAWSLLSILVPGLYNLALIGFMVREFGPTGYAVWAVAATIVGYLTILDLGLAQSTVRESARAEDGDAESADMVAAAGVVYLVLGVVAALAGAVLATVVPRALSMDLGETTTVGALLALDFGIVLATGAWAGSLRGTRRYRSLFATSTLQVVVSVGILLLTFGEFGLVGAAIAQVLGRAAGRALMLSILVRQVPWFRLSARWPSADRLRALAALSGPILLMQVASQIAMGTDVLIVGATAGAAAVGLYAAGAQLVRYGSSLLFPALDVVLPRFSQVQLSRPADARAVLVRVLRLNAFVGVLAFGTLAASGPAILDAWAGISDTLSIAVLMLGSLAYAAITASRANVLMMVAAHRHAAISIWVLCEAIANLVLSIVLAVQLGPVGPAVSTAIVVSLSSLVAIPWLTRRVLAVPISRILLPMGQGGILAAMIVGATLPLPGTLAAIAVRGLICGVALIVALRLDADKARVREDAAV